MRAAILLAYGAAVSAMGLPALLPRGSDFAKCFLQGDCHCDLSKVVQPSSGLPGPDSGLKPAMIAIGRGTQNYTCPDTGDASAVPVAVGALAKLYDFSCVASRVSPDQFGNITAAMQQVSRDDPIFDILPTAGVHYFEKTVPTFFLNNKLGTTPTKKLNSTSAPSTATNSVAWLKLASAEGATGDVKEVYRLDTANGNAPATCGDKKGLFTVEYAAEYWFYVPDTFCW